MLLKHIACRSELGRFPLNITINQKSLNYILYIQSKYEEYFVKQSTWTTLFSLFFRPAMERSSRRIKELYF